MLFPSPLIRGTLIERYKRFLADVRLDTGETVTATCPNTGSMLGLKAATTAGTIFFAERMWKTNKVGAIVMMVAINGATAVVSMHNMRNAKR